MSTSINILHSAKGSNPYMGMYYPQKPKPKPKPKPNYNDYSVKLNLFKFKKQPTISWTHKPQGF